MNRKSYQAFAFISLVVALVTATHVNQQKVTNDVREAQIIICERQKQDRIDNARGWALVSDLLKRPTVTLPLSTAERARRQVELDRMAASAISLRSRLLLCRLLVYERREVLDKSAVRESLK